MSELNDWKVIGPVIAALVGLYGFVLKHLANTDRHPGRKDIVYRDVCDQKTRRLEDCIESEIKLQREQLKSLEKTMTIGNKALADSIESVKDSVDRFMDKMS